MDRRAAARRKKAPAAAGGVDMTHVARYERKKEKTT
jgi:hypothetical protein